MSASPLQLHANSPTIDKMAFFRIFHELLYANARIARILLHVAFDQVKAGMQDDIFDAAFSKLCSAGFLYTMTLRYTWTHMNRGLMCFI